MDNPNRLRRPMISTLRSVFRPVFRPVFKTVFKNVFKNVFKTPADYLLPEKCALCQCISNLGFCINCQKLLPWIECACEICNIHLSTPGVCGNCQAHRPVYQDSIIPFRYKPPISNHIQALKYADQLLYAVAMGKMLSLWVIKNSAPLPDIIVPMPLHRKRIAQRGFNQATEIARVLNQQLGIPIDQTLLKRIKNTVPQAGLNKRMRQQNVRSAFMGKTFINDTSCAGDNSDHQHVVHQHAIHQHVALLDDVVTSGNTVNAATKALLSIGVKRVSVWAIAKT